MKFSHLSLKATYRKVFQVVSRGFCEMTSSSSKSICTHNGVFHCDDVLACYLLKQLPEYANSTIIRTRDSNIIDSCDIVVDVGGIYDHSKLRYDHHQREFGHTLSSLDGSKSYNIKLSSAGLVYHHYGRQVINQILGSSVGVDDSGDKNWIEILFNKIYESFIQEVDAIDNGVNICDGDLKYHITTDLSSRVGHLMPAWNEEVTDEILYDRFMQAIKLVGSEFEDRVNYYGKAWYPAKLLVKQAVEKRFSTHSSGAIIDLSEFSGVPWKEHIFSIEEELKIHNEIKFAVFKGIEGNWRIVAVPLVPKSFNLRLPLHPDYRGLRGEELCTVSQVSDCIFVHASGFIGGGHTRESCIGLAEKTMDNAMDNADGRLLLR